MTNDQCDLFFFLDITIKPTESTILPGTKVLNPNFNILMEKKCHTLNITSKNLYITLFIDC